MGWRTGSPSASGATGAMPMWCGRSSWPSTGSPSAFERSSARSRISGVSWPPRPVPQCGSRHRRAGRFHLSRADPPVLSANRAERFFRDVGRITIAPPKPSRKEQARRDAFEWMRALLQKEIGVQELHREFGDLPEYPHLLQRLYDGRLSDRNRALVILAKHHGLSRGVI